METQTIRQALEIKLQAAAERRLAQFREKGAPKALVQGLETKLANGDLAAKVGKIQHFGDLVFTAVANKKYRRGYGATFTVEAGEIHMIPGPYGLFLANKAQ